MPGRYPNGSFPTGSPSVHWGIIGDQRNGSLGVITEELVVALLTRFYTFYTFITVILKKVLGDILGNGKSIIRPPSGNLTTVAHMNISPVFSIRDGMKCCLEMLLKPKMRG